MTLCVRVPSALLRYIDMSRRPRGSSLHQCEVTESVTPTVKTTALCHCALYFIYHDFHRFFCLFSTVLLLCFNPQLLEKSASKCLSALELVQLII